MVDNKICSFPRLRFADLAWQTAKRVLFRNTTGDETFCVFDKAHAPHFAKPNRQRVIGEMSKFYYQPYCVM